MRFSPEPPLSTSGAALSSPYLVSLVVNGATTNSDQDRRAAGDDDGDPDGLVGKCHWAGFQNPAPWIQLGGTKGNNNNAFELSIRQEEGWNTPGNRHPVLEVSS